MLTDSLLVRDSSFCPSGQAYYICNINNFRGCCSSDPCDSGVCPDAGSSNTAPAQPPVTMSESVITHTISNTNIVTVTKHTIVTIGSPPPTSSPGIPSTTSVSTATSNQVTGAPPSSLTVVSSATGINSGSPSAGQGISSGAIAGVAIGGAVIIAVLAAMAVFMMKRHRKMRKESDTTTPAQNGSGRDDVYDEKHFPQSMSAHTTGTQEDPFSPFGGRADREADSYKPPTGAYEMDATSTAPVELPAVSVDPAKAQERGERSSAHELPAGDRGTSSKADPRSNLSVLRNDKGQPTYVNHWNQYKTISGE